GPEALCVLLYDDVVSDPAAVLSRACEHVGLDPDRAPAAGAPRVNTSGEARSTTAQSLMNRLGGKRSPARRGGRLLIPAAARERLRQWNQGSSTVPESVRRELAPSFADDIEALEELLGRRLPAWGRPGH